MRRGITLLELLLSLGLLSTLLVVTVSWVRMTSETFAALHQPLTWQHAATATLQLIHDDVISGDHPLSRQRSEPHDHTETVLLEGDVLLVHSRHPQTGHAIFRYELDLNTNQLFRGQSNGDRRLLLNDVHSFKCHLDPEERWMTVYIVSSHQQHMTRSYRLP